MIENTALINGLAFLITVLFGFILFYWFWQQYLIDQTRQQLFELRDNLFDIAAQNNLDFNSEVYITLRKMFNTAIRFTHEADWIHFLAFFIAARTARWGAISKSALHVEHLIKSIPDEKIRHHVEELMTRMHLTVAWHVYRRSLILIPVSLLMIVLLAFMLVSSRFLERAPRKVEKLINARAYSEIC